MGCLPIRLLQGWRGARFWGNIHVANVRNVFTFRLRFEDSFYRLYTSASDRLAYLGRNIRLIRTLVNQDPELARLIVPDCIISVVSPHRKVPVATSNKIRMEVCHPKVVHRYHFLGLSYTLHAYPLAIVRKEPVIRLKFLCTSPTLVQRIERMFGSCTNLPVSYLKDKKWGNSYKDLLNDFRLDWPRWVLFRSREN